MKIAIDFDGTICKRTGFPRKRDFHAEQPMGGAKQTIEWLLSMEHEVYVLTARPEMEWTWIKEWLTKHKFPEILVTNVKQDETKVIIDDRAIRFTNWLDISKYFG